MNLSIEDISEAKGLMRQVQDKSLANYFMTVEALPAEKSCSRG